MIGEVGRCRLTRKQGKRRLRHDANSKASPQQELLPRRNRVELTIVNLLGQAVRRLVGESVPAGRHKTGWAGTDTDGTPLASGICYSVLRVEETSHVCKMVPIKQQTSHLLNFSSSEYFPGPIRKSAAKTMAFSMACEAIPRLSPRPR